MSQLRDFCGFQWNGKHSSDLNIVRVSEGSRYSENLLPNFQDTNSQMAGSDGTLYWESFYTNKSWTINIAFDNLSETNVRSASECTTTSLNVTKSFDTEKHTFTITIANQTGSEITLEQVDASFSDISKLLTVENGEIRGNKKKQEGQELLQQ